jgi:hypothetical protein
MKKTEKNTDNINYLFKKLFSSENIRITCFIIPYLEYKDVYSLSRVSKAFHEIIRSHKVMKSFIIKGRLSPEDRILFYATNLNLSDTQQMVKSELSEYKIEGNYYENILILANKLYETDKKFKKICDEIGRDLHRTFYIEKFRTGNGRDMLKNILTGVGFIRPEIGYCQGMNFIAGALVNLLDNEEKCFWIFLSFIDNIQLNLLYLRNMPDFLMRVYQLKKLIELYFPKLGNHLKRNFINIDLFFSKWLLTIFSNYFKFDVLYKIWDVFIIEKWKALFKFCMVLLFFMKEELMHMDLNKFSEYFRSDKLVSSLSFEDIFKHYNDYKITNKQLKALQDDFFVDQIRPKLDNKDTVWEDDQKMYVDQYYKELENHFSMIEEPKINLRKKIEKIKKDYDYKLEKFEKQYEVVSNLKIKIDLKNEVKTGYENILKRLYNKNENNSGNVEENKTDSVIDSDKKNNDGIINSIMNFFSTDNSENAKIQKKIKDINKNIDDKKKLLDSNQKLLDKYKNELEICLNEQNMLEQQLHNIEENSKETQKNLLLNLSKRLKLSAKFVATNKY